jgi:sulfur-oxidizing protein SoxX
MDRQTDKMRNKRKIHINEFVVASGGFGGLRYAIAKQATSVWQPTGGTMKRLSLTLAMCLAGTMSQAGEVAPKDVQYDEYGGIAESLTGVAGDAANGALIVGSKKKGNCVACHAVTALSDVPFHGEIGPMLDGAGDRWSEAELRGLVANAKMTFEGTMMPAFYKVDGFIRPGDAYTGKAGAEPLPPILTAQEIEDVVAFLATLKEE